MPTQLAAPPLQTPIVEDARTGIITRVWENWLRSLTQRTQTSSYAVQTVNLTAQAASIALTPLAPSAAGLYRVAWLARISTPGTVSSSLVFSVVTTDGGVVCTQSGGALTGNTTATVQSGSVIVRVDTATPISYSTTYASAGAVSMTYDLSVILEQM